MKENTHTQNHYSKKIKISSGTVVVEEERILLLDPVQKQCDKADEEDDVNDKTDEDVRIGPDRNIDERCLARLHVEKW